MSWEDSGAILIDVTGHGEPGIFFGLLSAVAAQGVKFAQRCEDGSVAGHTQTVSVKNSHK